MRKPVSAPNSGSMRQSFSLPRGVHDQLRLAAAVGRTSQQAIIEEALDDWFVKRGLKPWADAAIEAEPEDI
jgi:hypothetical protein